MYGEALPLDGLAQLPAVGRGKLFSTGCAVGWNLASDIEEGEDVFGFTAPQLWRWVYNAEHESISRV